MRVCEVCKDPSKPVEEYEIKRKGGSEAKPELCATHAQPLETLLEATGADLTASQGAARTSGRRTAKKASSARRGTRRVSSMREIEALKAK